MIIITMVIKRNPNMIIVINLYLRTSILFLITSFFNSSIKVFISSIYDIPSQETCDCIVDVLQTFGVALKVNGFSNFQVVHSLYRSKYLLTLEKGGTCQKGEQSLPVNYLERALGEQHRSNDVVGSSVHKITFLNLPEMAQTSAPIKAPSVTFGTGIEGKSHVPIFPWVNADRSINKVVYDGLVRRVLATVMQNPGIPEDEIINLMDVLNPQSCRKLLELMTLDGYMKVREMVQTKFTGPPSLLTGLLLTGPRKPELIRRKHFFANSKGLFAL